MRFSIANIFLWAAMAIFASNLRAETGCEAWLRYTPIEDQAIRPTCDLLPASVVVLDDSAVLHAAREELIRGVRGLLGRTLRSPDRMPNENALVLGTLDMIGRRFPTLTNTPALAPDSFWLKTLETDGHTHLLITGPNDRGVLYGAFALLRQIGLQKPIDRLDIKESPFAPVRFLNHWDNLNGTIERGYAGKSIFWDNDRIIEDLGRVRDYARLMASVGINGCSINNVNADARVITPPFLVGQVLKSICHFFL